MKAGGMGDSGVVGGAQVGAGGVDGTGVSMGVGATGMETGGAMGLRGGQFKGSRHEQSGP